jgi:hypothetical protein
MGSDGMNWLEGRNAAIRLVALAAGAGLFASLSGPATAADAVSGPSALDPQPISEQRPAVDGLNFNIGAVAGVFTDNSNAMFLATVATPIPYFSQFGAQTDLAIGSYAHDYISSAAALHIFWRDPSIGMLGAYGDWAYVNPEHAGRVGAEGAIYLDRWSIDFFAGVQFGQHVLTEFVDEIDVSYYFTDNFKGAFGQRLTSRGNTGTLSFEYMPENWGGVSVYGQGEAGEDDYYAAWFGVRYAFGTGSAKTLIERDRQGQAMVRIPRNIASVTQCGMLPEPLQGDWWSDTEKTNLCASQKTLDDYGVTIEKQ